MRTASYVALYSCVLVICLALTPAMGRSQAPMADLWPNDDGIKWNYDFAGWDKNVNGIIVTTYGPEATLTLAGTTETAGGTAQNLVGWHSAPQGAAPTNLPPLYRNLWRARPDLRQAIEKQVIKNSEDTWAPLFLHEGYFKELPTKFEMWQDSWDHSTWTYMTDALHVGSKFKHQLVPELADNVFLHGTVDFDDAIVVTPAGTFTGAVKIAYELDYGESVGTDEQGQEIGLFSSASLGHVYYVPHVGPVDMEENYLPFRAIDCGASVCPELWQENLGVIFTHLSLRLNNGPVAIEQLGWGSLKKLYR